MKESLPIYETLGDLTNIAWTYGNMGVVYCSKKEIKRAIELYEKALSIFKKLGNVEGIKNTEQALASLKH
jgi:tetratricopeptide (TPR) repeat protein